ncbi:hypothetical protein RRG08_011958 [Elysia crispata]|uniref:Apple domain-containing protein n=1 Tax=Elysia crispata TaxID=231223 RepID=A0AAE1E453_9GAST|nr:hypothetical protein RRG08_011958 [Elysia crispata]
MNTGAYKGWKWILYVHLVLTWILFCGCSQVHFLLTSGQRVASNAKQLSFFSKSGMSNFLCAAACHRNNKCDLYHFNSLINHCAIFEEQGSFDPFVDLVSDPDWSTGYIQHLFPIRMRRGVWNLVFRAQSRLGVSVYDTWTDTSLEHDNPVPEDYPHACLRLTDYAQCDRHFRSHILNNWTNIQEVRFSLTKNEAEVAYIVFDGTNTDMTSWFSHSRILRSTWSLGLESETDLQPVTVKGSCDTFSCRRFLIHESYNLCRYEFFYTFTIDMAFDTCNTGTLNWELLDLSSFPVFLYAPGSDRASMGIDRGSYDRGQEADVLSVWIKFAT